MIINLGKKYELLAAAPDLYGRVYYFVSNGEIMSPKSYSKPVAEMVCAAWNGEDAKFYEVAEELGALQDFAQYILRETDNTIEERGFKPLEDIDPKNTKMHIHVFVERLQKVKHILKKRGNDV
jgi:hypothetical protein